MKHKISFIIYADLESLIQEIDECKNNPENNQIFQCLQYN